MRIYFVCFLRQHQSITSHLRSKLAIYYDEKTVSFYTGFVCIFYSLLFDLVIFVWFSFFSFFSFYFFFSFFKFSFLCDLVTYTSTWTNSILPYQRGFLFIP